MAYVICEKCGGYYELEEGESLEDFDTCQCGGSLKYANGTEQFSSDLRYVEKDPQMIKENDLQEIKESNKPKLICSNCMKENESGIFCSKCGGKLIAVKNGKVISNIGSLNEQKQIEALLDKIGTDYNDYKESKGFFERISWLGAVIGVVFFIVTVFISISLIYFLLFRSFLYYKFAFMFIISIVVACFFAVVSGSLSAFISKSKDYDNGLINGFLVGAISSVILGLLGGGISVVFSGIVVFGALAATGGIIGIFIRKQLYK